MPLESPHPEPAGTTRICIWLHELFDKAGSVLVGGVQTYVFELARVFEEAGYRVEILVPGVDRRQLLLHGTRIDVLPEREWREGADPRPAANVLHVVANAHGSPRNLPRGGIGIQHGIYWDRPSTAHPVLARLAPRLVNTIRAWKGAGVARSFAHLVCVDLAYPAMASSLISPFPWPRISYIPNFAPGESAPPAFTSRIDRMVFARRLERTRGTDLFVSLVRAANVRGWDGEIHIVGCGPEEPRMRKGLAGFPNIHFYRLPLERRFEAYTATSLVVIPSLSTEGTSLTCLEAWSRGALVLASSVGGLGNLVLDGFNGRLVRPLAGDINREALEMLDEPPSVEAMRRHGWECWHEAFSKERWRDRWLRVVEGCTKPVAHQPPVAEMVRL